MHGLYQVCFNEMVVNNVWRFMAKKKKDQDKDRYIFFGVLVVVAVGMIVFAYLMGVQQTLGTMEGSLPF